MAKMVGQIWNDLDPQIIVNGFSKGGIHPINKYVVPIEKFDLLTLQRWN